MHGRTWPGLHELRTFRMAGKGDFCIVCPMEAMMSLDRKSALAWSVASSG
jgi:hypothetical protein